MKGICTIKYLLGKEGQKRDIAMGGSGRAERWLEVPLTAELLEVADVQKDGEVFIDLTNEYKLKTCIKNYAWDYIEIGEAKIETDIKEIRCIEWQYPREDLTLSKPFYNDKEISEIIIKHFKEKRKKVKQIERDEKKRELAWERYDKLRSELYTKNICKVEV